jgi:hypothetical protein
LCAGGDDTDGLIGDPRDRNQHSKESIVEELWSVEVDEVESVEIQASDEDARVYAWRVERLSDLGLSNIVASAVAPLVDWHEIARLVERGCSPELALEIIR